MLKPAPGLMPAIEVMLTMDPPGSIARAARWVPTMTPYRSTAMTRSKSRRSSSISRRDEPEIPALFTITCSAPKRCCACSIAACTLSASETSV